MNSGLQQKEDVVRLDSSYRADFVKEFPKAKQSLWLKDRRITVEGTDDFDFDEILQSMTEDLKQMEDEKPLSLPPASAPVAASVQADPPSHFLRRAIREFESGSLDELLIHQLLQLDRNSAEFRQEYVRLRVESLMRPRATSKPSNSQYPFHGAIESKEIQTSSEMKSPWRINRFWNLWDFFGPWLTVMVALQGYASYNLARLLREEGVLPKSLSVYLIALAILGAALLASGMCLRHRRGSDFHEFSSRLIGIAVLSGAAAISSHVVFRIF